MPAGSGADEADSAEREAEMLRRLSASTGEAVAFLEAELAAPLDERRWLLAVHEAGHAAVAMHLRFTVDEIVLDRPSDDGAFNECWTGLGEPDGLEDPNEAHLLVAVAGYAHVGVHLGDAAEQANKAADPDEPDSDVNRAYARLRASGGSEAEMTDAFVQADANVRALLRNTCVGAVADEVADYLYRHGSMTGAALHDFVNRLCPPDK